VKPELKYGLLAGLAMSAWLLIEFWFGLHTTRLAARQYTNWVPDVIPVVMLYLLLKRRIISQNRYWLPAWEGMLHGLFASFFAALVYYIFLNYYQYFLNPTWVDNQLDWKVAYLRTAGATETDIRRQIVAMRQAFGPIGLALYIPAYTLLGGCVSALITLWLNWRQKEVAPLA
jgi:hypothetical protein